MIHYIEWKVPGLIICMTYYMYYCIVRNNQTTNNCSFHSSECKTLPKTRAELIKILVALRSITSEDCVRSATRASPHGAHNLQSYKQKNHCIRAHTNAVFACSHRWTKHVRAARLCGLISAMQTGSTCAGKCRHVKTVCKAFPTGPPDPGD